MNNAGINDEPTIKNFRRCLSNELYRDSLYNKSSVIATGYGILERLANDLLIPKGILPEDVVMVISFKEKIIYYTNMSEKKLHLKKQPQKFTKIMAVEVIKKGGGPGRSKTQCLYCGSEFTFDLTDTHEPTAVMTTIPCIACPVCLEERKVYRPIYTWNGVRLDP